MSFLGNIIWFVAAGVWMGLGWLLAGLFWCLTIIGLPIGRQCFKLARLSFFPFGKTIVNGGGTMSTLMNILWLIFSGLPIALVSALIGIVLCITIIGIPFGRQCFKLAKLALMPFGAEIM